MSFAWPAIQIVANVVALRLCHCAHASALWKVLPEQPVEVLVAASLPRVVRRCEVDLHREALFKLGLVMELGTVVEGDRLEASAVLSQRSRGRFGHLILGAALELLDDRKPGRALHQREHAVAQVAAHDRVSFPVPRLLPCLDLHRPLADVLLAWQHAPRVLTPVALASELAHDAGVTPQAATDLLVPTNAPVDGLRADVQLSTLAQRPADLLGAPALPDQGADPRHLLRSEACHTPAPPPPSRRIALRLLRSVNAVVHCRVAPKLPTDRAGAPAERTRNLGVALAAHAQRCNAVSFLLGELVVLTHVCNLLLAGIGGSSIAAHPTRSGVVLHLLVEPATPNPSIERTRSGSAGLAFISFWAKPAPPALAAHVKR